MFWGGSCALKYGLAMAQHNKSVFHSPQQPNWTTPPPLTQLHHYMFVCFKGFMVGVEAWAGCTSTLTQLVCTPATPRLHELGSSAADMAQHLVQPTPPLHHRHMQVLITLGGLGKELYNELYIRHLLQRPLKLTLAARHLHCLCCHLVMIHLA
jgi:hypothetical protein